MLCAGSILRSGEIELDLPLELLMGISKMIWESARKVNRIPGAYRLYVWLMNMLRLM